MNSYIEFPLSDSAIAVESAEYETSFTIPFHKHEFQEFVLISQGACMHTFRGIEVPLIAGDVFLIPPHQKHSYCMNSRTHFTNCYFFPEQLSLNLDNLVNVPDHSDLFKDEKSQTQGIIHLNPQEALRVESLLAEIVNEQNDIQFGTEYIKTSLLQMILVTIKRAQNRQPQRLLKHNSRKKLLISNALSHIDEHYSEAFDVPKLALDCALSESYFRMLFKEVTGLSPLEYLTRVRIIKSLEFLLDETLTISQVAEKVGIYDPNYFTRIFKKVMGYSPRNFKKN